MYVGIYLKFADSCRVGTGRVEKLNVCESAAWDDSFAWQHSHVRAILCCLKLVFKVDRNLAHKR